ncbi:retrovirus-related pol polyprotein from transposon TNT 1-94 [Tanacetum coccineum]
MDQHVKLQADQGTPLPDRETYGRLIGRLIYLIITRPDICFTVQVLSQFMQQPTLVHMQAAKHLLRYLLNNPGQANHVFHARTKHIEVDCHYVRDQVKVGIVKPSYVPSKAQVADIFTKGSIEVKPSKVKSRGHLCQCSRV